MSTDPAQPDQITSVLSEAREFPPMGAFSEHAHIPSMEAYEDLYRESIENPESFWAERAREELLWVKEPTKTLDWQPPYAKWFEDGTLNVSANCLDRFLGTPTANKAALIFEGEPGDTRTLTYRQLHREVCVFANVLLRNGVEKGDRILIYLPMVPEAIIAMLACARIGAPHSVVFGGFSAASVADRISDCGAKMVITADGGYRRGAVVPLKDNVDAGLKLTDEQGETIANTIENVIVLKRTGQDVVMEDGRDVWWHEETECVSPDCPPAEMNAEDPLFILYTSGSTGKPKGILHTSAGYLLGAKMTSRLVFDLKDEDIYWCTADVGWITGHSYIAYGPLANGATQVIYEGAPNFPEPDRFWQIVEDHGVTILYTAPTAIRAFMKWGDEWVEKHDLSTLRLLGTVGEPINPEAWMWYREKIGGNRCPIVDTWWQTETGSIMITPMPGATKLKPGTATLPFFGAKPEVVDDAGNEVPWGSGGKLIIRKPWPSMLRGIYGDPERFVQTYWSEIEGAYFTGDGARRDDDGYFWIVGRIDDVLNVSGHRIGTAEVESALVSHPAVAEAAVVGRPDELKGQALVVFVTLKTGEDASDDLKKELRNHVGKEIGPVAKPDSVRFAEALPKTRSGKIMRRLLKQIATGGEVKGDITTLEDLNVVAQLSASDED